MRRMASRPRPASTPGSNPGRAGRRPRQPRQGSTAVRRTTKVGAPAGEPAGSSRATFTGRAAILVLVMLVLAVSYASSARAWLRQRGEINDLTAQISQRQAAVDQLEQTRRRWHDPAYLEEQARCRFGWVMPGETGYSVIDANGDHLACSTGSTLSRPVDTSAPDTDTWYQNAWGTVVEAGQTPAEVAAAKQPEHQPATRITEHQTQDTRPSGAQQGNSPRR
jgi:cell division protein FtsB